jgi:hypothetical protein
VDGLEHDAEAESREQGPEADGPEHDAEPDSWGFDVEMEVPEPKGRIRIPPATFPELEEERVNAHAHARTFEATAAVEDPATGVLEPIEPSARVRALLAERERAGERQALADRVAYLFPRPEPCEWDVPEIGYDRRRRARAEVQAS